MGESPMSALLNDPSRCKQVAEDVSVHWFPSPDAEKCHCGRVDHQEDA